MEPKKKVPRGSDMSFIETARKIRHGRIHETAEIPPDLNGWRDVAEALLLNTKQNGEPGFWDTYNASATVRHQMEGWRKMVQVAPEKEEEVEEDEEESPLFTKGKNDKKVIRLFSIDDVYATPDPRYLINHILELASVSLLYGVSGTGKTFTSLDLALCVAHGLYWHGNRVKPGVVWYINTEGARGLKKRLKAWYKEHPDLDPTPNFKVIPWPVNLQSDLTDLLNTLDDVEPKPLLIVIDNFSMCTTVDQNKQDQVAPILRAVTHIVQTYGSHVLLVHHTNKDEDFNGTMAFRNHVDVMIQLKKEDKTRQDSPILFTSQKARDDEPFRDIRLELKQIILGTDPETLEPITSCVMVDTNQAEQEKPTPEIQMNMLSTGPHKSVPSLCSSCSTV